jgi:hypothetical protein
MGRLRSPLIFAEAKVDIATEAKVRGIVLEQIARGLALGYSEFSYHVGHLCTKEQLQRILNAMVQQGEIVKETAVGKNSFKFSASRRGVLDELFAPIPKMTGTLREYCHEDFDHPLPGLTVKHRQSFGVSSYGEMM